MNLLWPGDDFAKTRFGDSQRGRPASAARAKRDLFAIVAVPDRIARQAASLKHRPFGLIGKECNGPRFAARATFCVMPCPDRKMWWGDRSFGGMSPPCKWVASAQSLS